MARLPDILVVDAGDERLTVSWAITCEAADKRTVDVRIDGAQAACTCGWSAPTAPPDKIAAAAAGHASAHRRVATERV